MKYYIGNYTWSREDGVKVKEYYISDNSGNIIAGDFSSYTKAKQYIASITKHTK